MFSALRSRDSADAPGKELREERDRFIETAYFHINEPLETVVGLADLLMDRTRHLNAGVRNEIIELLAMHVADASRVVNDLLIVARFDMDDLDLGMGTVELRDVVDAATTGWASKQRSRLSVTGNATGRADEQWVTHIVGNLLRNAVAHGGANIWVKITEGHNRVVLEVIDDGKGVRPADAELIFEPYFSSPGDVKRRASLGLGLHVSRRLARAMGGEVTYERHDGRTVFALSLPRVNLQSVRRSLREDLEIDPFEGKPNEEAIGKVIESGGPKIAYQPIVDIEAARNGSTDVVGYEALARFPFAPPPVWFETASSHGLRGDLELSAIAASVSGFTPETPGFLAVNLSDATLVSSRLREAVEGIDPGRVVLELSESAVIRNYELTKRHIEALQDVGFRLAIDDLGAGEIDLWHMLRLNPDFIKIDMSLVRDLHNEPRNRALIRGVAAMGDDLGIMVIAEGVESFQEEEKLLTIGVRYGQGYRYGKPGALQWKSRVLDSDE